MDEKIIKLLYDIEMAIQAINSFCYGKSKIDYQNQLILRSAVERQYDIIGEALSKIRKIDAAFLSQISESEKIIAFRNILIHAYDVVDPNIAWDILENKLPILYREIIHLLQTNQ